MTHWGRRLLVVGAVMALVSATPALLISLVPGLGENFFGTLAILLTITVTPLGVVFLGIGLALLLAGVTKRGLALRARARASSPPDPPAR